MAVSVNIANAPLVISNREVKNIKLDDRAPIARDEFTLQMQTQSLEDVRYILRAIAIQEVDQQVRIDNQPSRLLIDNREGKFLHLAQRRVEVLFGNVLDQVAIKALHRAVLSEVRRRVAIVLRNAPLSNELRAGFRTLAAGGTWQWFYAPTTNAIATRVNPYTLKSLPFGSKLILMPNSQYVTLANMLDARLDAGWRGWKLWQRGRSRGRGFMVSAVDKIRRNRALKTLNITVTFTQRFALSNEIAYPGRADTKLPKSTVCVVVKAARRTRAYRRR